MFRWMSTDRAIPSLTPTAGFVWNISVDPDETMFTDPADDNPDRGTGGSTAIDVGFDLSGGLSAASAAADGTNVLDDNPGHSTFGDEITGEGVDPGTDLSNVFASVGTDFFTDGALKRVVTISTEPLTTANLTTSIAWGGGYDANGDQGAGNFGAVAQAAAQVGVQGSASFTALAGDANLDGTVDLLDLDILGSNFNQSPRTWAGANFNGHLDNITDLLDLDILGGNFGASSGAGSVSAGQVPEPSSIVLAGLLIAAAGMGIRRRS